MSDPWFAVTLMAGGLAVCALVGAGLVLLRWALTACPCDEAHR